MKLLKPGNGHQAANRQRAVDYITETMIDAKREPHNKHNNIIRTSKGVYWVSSYAESGAVMVRAPNKKNEDWTNEMAAFCDGVKLFRQFKDGRIAIYTVNAHAWKDIVHEKAEAGLSKVEWSEVSRLCCEPPIVTKL